MERNKDRVTLICLHQLLKNFTFVFADAFSWYVLLCRYVGWDCWYGRSESRTRRPRGDSGKLMSMMRPRSRSKAKAPDTRTSRERNQSTGHTEHSTRVEHTGCHCSVRTSSIVFDVKEPEVPCPRPICILLSLGSGGCSSFMQAFSRIFVHFPLDPA